MNNYMPTKIYTGANILNKHENVFNNYGKKCFIVCSQNASKASGALDDVLNILNKFEIEYEICDEVKQNPSVLACIEIGKNAFKFNANFIVGIGGGSVLDATKCAAIVACNPDITEEMLYKSKWEKHLPYILIGTTAGTGAEVTPNAVLTQSEGTKKSIKGAELYADYCFGDYRYTNSMPDKIRKATAIDALAHLMESYFSNKANDISRAYSFEGIRLIYPNLKLLAQNIELNDSQKEAVFNASIIGGLAINITGTTFCHNLGYYFTENYELLHGIACAIFEEDLICFEEKNNKEYVDNFFNTLNIKKDDFINTINSLLPDIDINLSLEEINKILPRYENNSSVLNTYGSMAVEDIKQILIKKFSN